eukprot:GHVR01117886.1.p1 GENE.GHVR01117886.1~~GHVR01117886.1.p1  ORF type:complete len:129 (-),score=23.31 GHVR01117886.1:165-551(-)
MEEERRRQQIEMNRNTNTTASKYEPDNRMGYDNEVVDIKQIEGYDDSRLYGYMPSGDWTHPAGPDDVDDTIVEVRNQMIELFTGESRFEMGWRATPRFTNYDTMIKSRWFQTRLCDVLDLNRNKPPQY